METNEKTGSAAESREPNKRPLRMQTMNELDTALAEEVVEKRNTFAKTYSLGENMYQAVVYGTPVHYRDKATGEWREIDNTLVAGKTRQGTPCLMNKANGGLKATLCAVAHEPLVSLENEQGDTLSWTLEDVKADGRVMHTAGTMKDWAPTLEAVALKKGKERQARREQVLAQNSGEGLFTDVLPGTDMRCHVEGTTFKDELIFRARASAKPVGFLLRAPGLTLSLQEDQSIHALRPDGERAFLLPAPYMTDADGNEGKVSVTLCTMGDGAHRLTYVPDEAWLNGAQFPVAMDPMVITDRENTTGFVYKCVSSDNYNYNYQMNHGAVRQVCYMKFNPSYLPAIDASSYITKALFYASPGNSYANSKDRVVYLREVLSSWTTSMTYAAQPNCSSNDTDTAIAPAGLFPNLVNFYFDVSNLVRKWYSGTNHGFVMDVRDNAPLSNAVYVNVNASTGASPPYLVVNYVSYAGLVDHLAYESHSVGRAGTAHVNLLTGNLVFEHADTAGNGNRMPSSVTHYFNTCDGTSDMYKMGARWRTSLHQTLYGTTIRDYSETYKLYFVYTDGSGRQHHFRPDINAFYNIEAEDQSGLSLKLKITTTEATIRDKYDNILTFDRPEYSYSGSESTLVDRVCPLKSITNAQGDVITIAAATVGKTIDITSVTDGAGRKTTFTTSGTRIGTIKGPGEVSGTRFTYDASGRLTKITHEDNAETTYGYSSSGYLTTITNHDGRKLTIAYTGAKVKSVTESNGGVTGNSREYTYASSMTTITDMTVPNGKKLFYHFDDYGNVTSVSDELGYATLAKYNEALPPHKPEMLSKLQRSVVNLLQNHSFDSDTGWAHEGGEDLANEESTYSTHCLRFANNAYQTVALTPGKTYTLSYYAKRSGTQGIQVLYGYRDAQGQARRIELPCAPEEISGLYSRFSHSFTLPEEMQSNDVTLHFVAVGSASDSSVVCIDFVQLEEGPIANRYNMLLNGDFSLNTDDVPTHWTAAAGNTPQDKVMVSADPSKPAGLTPNVLRINGAPGVEKGVYQEIPVSGLKGEVFVAGGWARGYTRPRKGKDKLFGLRVSFKTSNNAYKDTKSVEWEEEWTAWTLACGPVIAPDNFTSIRFHVDYQDNVNYADFGGLFLHREGFGRSFAYDSKGNVLSVQNLAGQKNQAVYDSFNNLTSYRPWGQPDTVKVLMDYGSTDAQRQKHLLLKSTSPTGIVQEYTYDASGNATSTKVSAAGTAAFMKTTAAYTANRNYVSSLTNSRGKTVTSQIDATKGTLTSVTDPAGQTVAYAYDNLKRVTSSTAVANGKTYRNEYAYTHDRLTQVKHNTDSDTACDVVYNFEHDAFGNPLTTKVGNQPLSSIVYTETGDKLPMRIEYGNGGKLHYDRDAFKRVTALRYDEETAPRYVYSFDASGNTAYVTDNHLNRTVTNEFDLSNRPMRVVERENGAKLYTVELAYDECNRLGSMTEKLGNDLAGMTTRFAYDTEDRPTRIEMGSPERTHVVAYDALGWITSRTKAVGSTTYTTGYTYLAGGHGQGSTTTLVETISQPGEMYSYTYDDVGRITSTTRNGSQCTYVYDGMGQLIRANDFAQGKTYTYSYDRGGNLLEKREYAYTADALGAVLNTVPYTYGDSNWKDKLTAYNGTPITYDAIGNPLDDGTWMYAWQVGRQLAAVTKAGEHVAFAYNEAGLRVRKESQSRGVTEYTLRGDRLSHLKRGNVEMHFWYAQQERPTMTTYNGHDYLYVYNGQGDVVALVDMDNGCEKVVEYAYDAWGKQVGCAGPMASTLGVENPLRYRGYVYDEETGWYYLRSRYYNPEWGRFINADLDLGRIGKKLAHNIYSYCLNNAVCLCDPDGRQGVAYCVDGGGVAPPKKASQTTEDAFKTILGSNRVEVRIDVGGNEKDAICEGPDRCGNVSDLPKRPIGLLIRISETACPEGVAGCMVIQKELYIAQKCQEPLYGDDGEPLRDGDYGKVCGYNQRQNNIFMYSHSICSEPTYSCYIQEPEFCLDMLPRYVYKFEQSQPDPDGLS